MHSMLVIIVIILLHLQILRHRVKGTINYSRDY